MGGLTLEPQGRSFGMFTALLKCFLLFVESLLSLKKSKLLQLLNSEEEGISDFPGGLNASTCSHEGEKDTVSFFKCVCFNHYMFVET